MSFRSSTIRPKAVSWENESHRRVFANNVTFRNSTRSISLIKCRPSHMNVSLATEKTTPAI